jgi:hypothetical protein
MPEDIRKLSTGFRRAQVLMYCRSIKPEKVAATLKSIPVEIMDMIIEATSPEFDDRNQTPCLSNSDTSFSSTKAMFHSDDLPRTKKNCRLNEHSSTPLSVHRQPKRGRQRSAIWAISRTAGRRPRKEILTLRIAWNSSLWRLRSYVSLELKVRLWVRENKTAITARLYSPTMLFSERRLL